MDAVHQRNRVAGVLVGPARPAPVHLRAHLVADVVGAARDGDVDRDRSVLSTIRKRMPLATGSMVGVSGTEVKKPLKVSLSSPQNGLCSATHPEGGAGGRPAQRQQSRTRPVAGD